MKETHFNATDDLGTEADHLITPTTLEALETKHPLWSVIVLETFFVIVFFIGIIGNTVIIRVVTSERKRSSTDWFILFLAISDIICSSITVPMSMVNNLPKHVVSFPSIVCKIHLFFYVSTYLSSMLFFILLGIDRYLRICHPRIKNYIADRPCLVGSLVTLIVMILGANRFRTTEVHSNGICFFDAIDSVHIQSLTIGSVLTLLCFVVCVMYYKVIVKMKSVACQKWHDSASTPSHNQQKQIPSCSRIFPSNSETMRNWSDQASTSHRGTLSVLSTDLQSNRAPGVQSKPNFKNSQDKQELTEVMSTGNNTTEIKVVPGNRIGIRPVAISTEPRVTNQEVQINQSDQNEITAVNAEERNKMTSRRVSFVRKSDSKYGKPEYFQQQGQKQNVMDFHIRNTNILESTRVLVFMTALYILFTIIPLDIVLILIACKTLQYLEWYVAMLFLSKLFYVNVVINVFIYYKLRTGFRTKVRKLLHISRRQITM